VQHVHLQPIALYFAQMELLQLMEFAVFIISITKTEYAQTIARLDNTTQLTTLVRSVHWHSLFVCLVQILLHV